MAERYFGWIGTGGYDGVVMIKNYSEAYVMTNASKEFHRNDEFLKAMWNPGSEFEEISEAEAKKIIGGIQK